MLDEAMRAPRSSPLAMGLLSLIWEEPMHAYRMQQLIKERHRDQVVNVAQRNSIYQTLQRLMRSGLVAVRETLRDEKRPERTVYEITPLGRRTLEKWLRAMLSTPSREFPEFPAALAFMPSLAPDKARAALEQRAAALVEHIAALDSQSHHAKTFQPRLFLLGAEHERALVSAELEFVRGLLNDLTKGRLTWDPKELRKMAGAK
jgi:DNA-binding PadR family transcriptional regulator